MEELKRVMHVDDDESIRMITSVALETIGGLEVQSCQNGFEALEKYGVFSPQVILLDVMMPEMDGPATLDELKKRYDLDKIMVLFMTAKVQQEELDYFREEGAFDVILKPFDPMALAEQVLAQWKRFGDSASSAKGD